MVTTRPVWDPGWLRLVAVATVGLVLIDTITPGVGVIIAASVAFYWAIQSGAVRSLAEWLSKINSAKH